VGFWYELTISERTRHDHSGENDGDRIIPSARRSASVRCPAPVILCRYRRICDRGNAGVGRILHEHRWVTVQTLGDGNGSVTSVNKFNRQIDADRADAGERMNQILRDLRDAHESLDRCESHQKSDS
jgi:hypothetical protein